MPKLEKQLKQSTKQSKQPQPQQKRPASGTRRRGATLENALLDAAWEELHSVGYTRLTMERVAERAGTSRAVIYRRWGNRAELVIAAQRHHQPVLSGRIPDTGTLRGDVLAVLRRASRRISTPGPDILVGLLADLLADDEAYGYLQDQLLSSGTELMMTIVGRAATRGQARSDVTPRIARLPLDLLRHELILTRHPPSRSAIYEIVDDIFLPLVRETKP
jgi:AcrR family transcriptional regulator